MWWLILGLTMAPVPPTPALAVAPGEIFGEIKSGDDYVADADLKLTCAGQTTAGKTDSTGSFRLRAQVNGKCTLAVSWKKETPTIEVVVFERPTRYRLVIEDKAGKLVLRRV